MGKTRKNYSRWAVARYWLERQSSVGATPFVSVRIDRAACMACEQESQTSRQRRTLPARWNDSSLEKCHIVPIYMGGADELSNIVLMCSLCHVAQPDSTNPEHTFAYMRKGGWRGSAGLAASYSERMRLYHDQRRQKGELAGVHYGPRTTASAAAQHFIAAARRDDVSWREICDMLNAESVDGRTWHPTAVRRTWDAMQKQQVISALVALEWERKHSIGVRTRAGMAQRKREGVHCGRRSALPVAVVRRICRERETGATMQAIADRLNAEGVPTATTGAKWYASTVRRVLTSSTAQRLVADEYAKPSSVSARTKWALAERRAQGQRLGRPDTLSADVVGRIIEERQQGRTLRAIAAGLEADRIPTAHGGNAWHARTISKVLQGQQAAALQAVTRVGVQGSLFEAS